MVHVRRTIASELHDAWRAPRRQKQQQRDHAQNVLARGGAAATRTPSYLPRWKVVDGKTFDIANLDFEFLPKCLQASNLSAAHCACSAVERAVRESSGEGDCLDGALFMESAAAAQHANWMELNREWADDELLVPYGELPDEIKEKDRSIVRVAIRRFRAYTRTVFGFIPAHVRRMAFFEFERELARYCEALRQNGHLGVEADLLEIKSTELLLYTHEGDGALEESSKWRASASSTAGWNIVAAACSAMRSAMAPNGPETLLIDPGASTASMALSHGGGKSEETNGQESRRRGSVGDVTTATAAVEIGSELAHTARIAKNVDLCIDVANEVPRSICIFNRYFLCEFC